MGFWRFFVTAGVGPVPATIVYSYVGGIFQVELVTYLSD